jgi:hypothetical protein
VSGLYHAFSDPATEQERQELLSKIREQNAKGDDIPEDLALNPSRATLAYHRLIDAPADQLEKKSDNEKEAARDLLAQRQNWKGTGLYASGAVDRGLAAIPMVGPWINSVAERAEKGDVSGAATDIAAALAIQNAKPLAEASIGKTKGALSSTMAETPPNEEFTRGELLDYARENGVNLDVADATGSGVAQGLKGFAERSLAGRGTMKANASNNLQAVQAAADSELAKYAPESLDRNALGTAIQSRLQANYEGLKASAADQFSDLDKQLAAKPVSVADTVQQRAQAIIDSNKGYYDAHPELKPKQAWEIVKDLATDDRKSLPWSELHQLRSDLMDFYRNNPDLTKSRAESWIQQLVSSIDNSMTDASSGLTDAQRTQFRSANSTWEQMKATYDNPQHPFFSAVRSQMPSQVPGILSNKTPELAAQVQDVLGQRLAGQFQRDFVNRLLDPNGDGTYDLAGLNNRVQRLPADYVESVLGSRGARSLKLLARTAKTVSSNMNPSGTSDVMVPAGEFAGLFTHPVPTALELAGAHGMAKALTSPTMLDFLVRKSQVRTTPFAGGNSLPLSALLAGSDQEQQ